MNENDILYIYNTVRNLISDNNAINAGIFMTSFYEKLKYECGDKSNDIYNKFIEDIISTVENPDDLKTILNIVEPHYKKLKTIKRESIIVENNSLH